MLTKKVLPLNTDPFIKTYPFNAFYLGIMDANGIDINDILLNEFLNIHCYYYKYNWHVDFCGSGFVEKNRFVTKHKIKTKNISPEEVKNILNDNYYIMLNLNERYIGIPEVQREYDYFHDWLIFGYDDSIKKFYCCGYINKKELGEYYGALKIDYDDLITAVKKVPKRYLMFQPYKLKNHFLKINKSYQEKKLSNRELIKKLVELYSPKIITFYHVPYILNDVKGINFFLKKFKQKHIDIYMKNDHVNDAIYLQDIRNLYEQKKVISLILKRLNCSNNLIEQQDNLVKEAYTNLLMCVKYNYKPQKKLSVRIYNKIINIEKRQQHIIQSVCKLNDLNINS